MNSEQVITTSEYSSHSGMAQNIVVIGGGTGNSMVIEGLSSAPFSGAGVIAIVSTFDDGGGTGELRRVYEDLPAVGDLRQCYGAMSRLSEGALASLERRYAEGQASDRLKIKGQTTGNLLIASTLQSEIARGGNFSSALQIVGEFYQTKGKVVPASNDVRSLRFELPDSTVIEGEHNAEESTIRSFKGANIGFDKADTNISEEAETAIKSADMVVLAPGDLYTSIGPNLVVKGMREALQAAKVVVMISNLMNRNRHTYNFTTLDYVREYTRLIGARVIDRVIFNTQTLDTVALEKQAKEFGSYPVRPNLRGLKREGYIARPFDLLSAMPVKFDPNDGLQHARTEIRHDPAKVASALMSVYTLNGFEHDQL